MNTTRQQRKRVKGWRKPLNSVYVGYGTKYGNPFKWKELQGGKGEAVELYKVWFAEAVSTGKLNVAPLRGKVLLCFCALNECCHADVLCNYLNSHD